MRHRRTNPAGTPLAAECGAFLDGSYAEHLVDRVQIVPAWSWLNLLAHGTEAEIRDAARSSTGRGWRGARRFLAGEVVDRIESGHGPLEELQRSALVPLELKLASLPSAARWGPGQLVVAVLAILPERRVRSQG